MDDRVREAIKNAMKRETFAQTLNMKLVKLEDGHSVVEMIYTPENMNNIHNGAHGGALFGLMDEAFEAACHTKGTIAVALNMNVTFVTSPKPGSKLHAEANQISDTKETACFAIKITDPDGNIIATSQALAYQTGKPLPFL
ncbi:MAG: PaaI family thioesterase [Desulfobacterales bacterium]